ncbi:hypothetical protein [Pseudomonas sp. RIT-PI-AD]|uniref:hypothetical protein n=1 Tax=Pseudomonas sp. RIT-PI-AD TaxID=3035294 RepID=UPI0021D91D6D|nr:hypothetical protein [Pseudomonas sp. RIT-PI-AD]
MRACEARERRQAWRFVCALLATLGIGLAALATLNGLANPFGRFDQPLRPGFNDTPSATFYASERAAQLRWLTRQAQHAGDQDLLIGTSHVLFGMETCALPRLRRLALLRLSLAEVGALAPVLAATPRPRTLSIELGMADANTVTPVPASGAPLWRELFGWEATRVSLATLWRSRYPTRREPASSGACASEVHPGQWGHEDAEVAKLIAALRSPAQLAAQQRALGQLVQALAPACARHAQRLRLFSLPVYASPAFLPALLDAQRRAAGASRRTLRDYQRLFPGCRLEFRDLATPYTRKGLESGGIDRADWLDWHHFRPALGADLLRALQADAVP